VGKVTPHSNNETAPVTDDPHGVWAELFADFADWRYLGKTPFEFERLVSELPEPVPAPETAPPTIFSVARRLGPGAIARLVGAYESGTPTTQLMRDFGIAKGTVLRLLKENGVAMRQQPIPAEVISTAAELYETGLSLATVAERLGVNTSTLFLALRRAGVQMRPTTGGRNRA
jgi:transposase-like protein